MGGWVMRKVLVLAALFILLGSVAWTTLAADAADPPPDRPERPSEVPS